VPSVSTRRPGSAIAAAPAPTQPVGRYDAGRPEYVGGAGVVVVVPVVVVAVVVVAVVPVVVVAVVVVDVVVVVPAAYAEAAPSAARRTPRTRSQTPRRIAPVCRSSRRFAEMRR
jgi:Flp pilus assembly protein TadB